MCKPLTDKELAQAMLDYADIIMEQMFGLPKRDKPSVHVNESEDFKLHEKSDGITNLYP